MTTQNDEDEWDRVELKLEAMKVSEIKQIAKPPITIAPRFNSVSAAESKSSSSFSAPVVDNSVEQVDVALYNAMTNPRERMAVLQMENSILNFVKTSMERSMDIPPVFNSFRRLLAYRVGQRFGLQHMQSDYANENGERGITLLRTSYTCVPRVLLIDLNIPVKDEDSSQEQSSFSNLDYNSTATVAVPVPGSSTKSTSSNASSASSVQQAPKKFQVMKRNPARSDQDGNKGVSVKQQQSAEDKEKAYQEARARIFGDESGSTASTPGAGTPTSEMVTGRSSPAPSTDSTTNKDKRGGASPSTRSSNSSSPQPVVTPSTGKGGTSSGIASTPPVKRVTSDSQLNSNQQQSQQQNSGGKKKEKGPAATPSANTSGKSEGVSAKKQSVVDANGWKGSNKSVMRDVEAERSDPDFARRGGGGGQQQAGRNNGGGGLSYNTPVFYPGNNLQQQQMSMQQQQMQQSADFQQAMYFQDLQYQQMMMSQQQGGGGGVPMDMFQMQQQQQASLQAAAQYHQYAANMEAAAMAALSGSGLGMDGSRLGQYNTATTQLNQQQQAGFNAYPPLNNIPIAPTLQVPGGNPYYPTGENSYYPQGDGTSYPPAAPSPQQAPSESFYDYSHLSFENQRLQQQQQNGGGGGGGVSPNNRNRGGGGGNNNKTTSSSSGKQQQKSSPPRFNIASEFPPLA